MVVCLPPTQAPPWTASRSRSEACAPFCSSSRRHGQEGSGCWCQKCKSTEQRVCVDNDASLLIQSFAATLRHSQLFDAPQVARSRELDSRAVPKVCVCVCVCMRAMHSIPFHYTPLRYIVLHRFVFIFAAAPSPTQFSCRSLTASAPRRSCCSQE